MPTLALIRMSTEALTDEGLLDACRAGDESAFVALVRRPTRRSLRSRAAGPATRTRRNEM
ncbi:MAG: hypothetical protein QOF69_2092, partial [Solirubrobacteraceae bacterium]|nr:hypothetical protein [Solirubrobacteraceae bacterium]